MLTCVVYMSSSNCTCSCKPTVHGRNRLALSDGCIFMPSAVISAIPPVEANLSLRQMWFSCHASIAMPVACASNPDICGRWLGCGFAALCRSSSSCLDFMQQKIARSRVYLLDSVASSKISHSPHLTLPLEIGKSNETLHMSWSPMQ
jgi:hypothetical protein